MNSKNKVWVSILNYSHVNIHSIGMHIPELYDYPALQENRLKYFKDQENEEIVKKNKELGAYGLEIGNFISKFEKFPKLPNSLWLESDKEALPNSSEYIFKVQGGGVVFNEDCANILKKFNLGNSTLTPLKIHKLFTDELWLEDTFYFLNLCEHREYVATTQNHEDIKHFSTTTFFSDFLENDNMLEVNQKALTCDLDLWHDPRYLDSYFLSADLHHALLEANMHEKWNALFCKLV